MEAPSSTYIRPLHTERDDSKCIIIAFGVVAALIVIVMLIPKKLQERFAIQSGSNRMMSEVSQPGQSYKFHA